MDDLIFVDQLGQVLTKADDLDLHRSGALRLEALYFSGYRLRPLAPGRVLAVLRADVAGSAGGHAFENALRFTRVWRREADGWRVATAQCTTVA